MSDKLKIHACDEFSVQKFVRKRPKNKPENLPTLFSSTSRHFQNDKLTNFDTLSIFRGFILLASSDVDEHMLMRQKM